METVTLQKHDNPWKIARRTLGSGASNTEVANYANSIMKANNITDPTKLIYNSKTPTILTLPDKPVTADTKPAEAEKSASKNPIESEKPKKSLSLDSWMRKVADGKKMKPFDMIAKEDVDAEGNVDDKAYGKNFLTVAEKHIKLYDTDGDGEISLKEQIKGDLRVAEKEYTKTGSLDAEDRSKITDLAKQTYKFIAGKTGIDTKRYAAFLDIMDNDGNGFITGNEYDKALEHITKPSTKGANIFKEGIKNAFDTYSENEKLKIEAKEKVLKARDEAHVETEKAMAEYYRASGYHAQLQYELYGKYEPTQSELDVWATVPDKGPELENAKGNRQRGFDQAKQEIKTALPWIKVKD